MSVAVKAPETVSVFGPWPYDFLPGRSVGKGEWSLHMTASGHMYLWPSAEKIPDSMGAVHVIDGDRGELKKFLVGFCSLGRTTDESLVHQDGRNWIFNWVCGTLAQVHVASRVAAQFMGGDNESAVKTGRAFEAEIIAALDKLTAK